MRDAHRSLSAVCMIRDEMLRKSGVVQELLPDQARDCGLCGRLRESTIGEALAQFAGAVVAPVQELERRQPGRQLIIRSRRRGRIRLPPPHS